MRKFLMFVMCIGLLFIPATISNSEEQAAESDKAVPICLEGKTIFIPESELQEHLERGAAQGVCPKASSESSGEYQKQADKEENEKEGKQEKVIICHKGWLTLSIAKAAVPAHLKHGDTLGACPDSSNKKGDLKKTEDKKTEDNDSEEKKPKEDDKPSKGKGRTK